MTYYEGIYNDIAGHIRRAARGLAEPPALRTMADFIDRHLPRCCTVLTQHRRIQGHFKLVVKSRGGKEIYSFSTLEGKPLREVAMWIVGMLPDFD
jgi:hypothetical protein